MSTEPRQRTRHRMIFINLPVADLTRSWTFYSDLGFTVDQRFSDERCVCIVVSSTICVMLLGHEKFAEFIAGDIADTHRTTGVVHCLSAASREEVDELVGRALAAGGSPWLDKFEGCGMYGHSFADPDGHAWELLHLEFPGDAEDN